MATLLSQSRIADLQLEGAIQVALEHHAQVPFERIRVSVADGVATISGTVDWRYQQVAALAATRAVGGVRDVHDRLTVTFF